MLPLFKSSLKGANISERLRFLRNGAGSQLKIRLSAIITKTATTTTTTSLFLTLNIQISHHLQIARLIEAGGV